MSHLAELSLHPGFKLLVSPSSFVVHADHGTAPWAQGRRQNMIRVYASWYGFLFTAQKHWGGGDFYGGPPLRDVKGLPPLTYDPRSSAGAAAEGGTAADAVAVPLRPAESPAQAVAFVRRELSSREHAALRSLEPPAFTTARVQERLTQWAIQK